MERKITNDNLYLLLPAKAVGVAQLYAGKHGVSPIEALRLFYQSNTYKRLEQEETKLWHYGPVALYEEFMENQ